MSPIDMFFCFESFAQESLPGVSSKRRGLGQLFLEEFLGAKPSPSLSEQRLAGRREATDTEVYLFADPGKAEYLSWCSLFLLFIGFNSWHIVTIMQNNI